MSSNGHSILELDRVTMRFKVGGNLWNSQWVTAVDNVTLAVPKGVTVGIVGESGSGKSTLARIGLGLIQPTAGDVRVDGRTLRSRSARELRTMRRQVQAVFQDPSSSLNPRQTVKELVATPFLIHRNLAPRDPTSAVVQTLQRVGLGREHLGRFPHQLSGGQRQRVAIARALILEPELIIADEPTSALDVSIQAQIVSLLRGIQADTGCGLLFISHNLGIVRHLADWVAVMYLGRIVELGPSGAVFSQACHPYTQLLIDAVPIPDPRRRRSLPDLQATATPSSAGRQGCRFADRCPKRFARCFVEDPADTYVEQDHYGACHLNEGAAAPATGSPQPGGDTAAMLSDRGGRPAADKRGRKKEMW